MNILNDRDSLALRIRLLFSTAIQLLVILVSSFLKNFENLLRLHVEFAERLKTLRKQVKLAQVRIAEKLEISQQPYASGERGVKKQHGKISSKLYKILNMTVDYLVKNSKKCVNSIILNFFSV